MTREDEEKRINEQIEENMKGHEIPAPEVPKKEPKPQAETAPEELLNAETPQRQDLINRINHTLNKIRPYIQADGGDVQFEDYKDGVVTVSMLGACAGCFMASADITEGIQAILIDEVPEVKAVKMLESSPWGPQAMNF